MSKTFCRQFSAGLVFLLAAVPGRAELSEKFLGAESCGSSSCHGGGGVKQNQYLVWSLKDFHSQRPPATLATARSRQIAEALAIKNPVADPRCTVCHAPLNEVPDTDRGEYFKVGEGVSCESCHGPAEKWIRSHTRTDYSHADRVLSGMRDLQNLYVRANTCVACHQFVSQPLLKAGHPALIFELDGQGVAEPKHWPEAANWNGAQTWLVGQAVAARELSWHQGRNELDPANPDELDALKQLLDISAHAIWPERPEPPVTSVSIPVGNTTASESWQNWYDQVARDAAAIRWNNELTRQILSALTSPMESTTPSSGLRKLSAAYAARLVLALDRLVASLPSLKNDQPVQTSLNQLFAMAQSAPDFDAARFAATLAQFRMASAPDKTSGQP